MSWCPKCKNEYREGITHCPDCDVDLVDTLLEEVISDLDSVEIPVLDSDEIDHLTAKKPVYTPSKTYKDPKVRYEDEKSTAWTFLILGGIGVIVMVLSLFDIISLPLHNFVLYVMTGLFVIFIFVGINAFQRSKKLKGNIAEEYSKINDMETWYKTEGVASVMKHLDTTLPETELFFQKDELIHQCFIQQYPDLDEATLDMLVEKVFDL